jgi:hypothetical protein
MVSRDVKFALPPLLVAASVALATTSSRATLAVMVLTDITRFSTVLHPLADHTSSHEDDSDSVHIAHF